MIERGLKVVKSFFRSCHSLSASDIGAGVAGTGTVFAEGAGTRRIGAGKEHGHSPSPRENFRRLPLDRDRRCRSERRESDDCL